MKARRTRLGGLRTKIIVWFLVPTAIILSAVAVLVFSTSRRAAEELAFSRSEDRARLLASQLSAEIETYRQALARLAAEPVASSAREIQAALDDEWPVGLLSVFDAGVLVMDPDGFVVASPPRFEIVGDRLPRLLAAASQTPEGSLGYSDVLRQAVGHSDVLALAYPLETVDDGDPGWVVGLFGVEPGATRSKTFYQAIWSLYIGRQLSVERTPAIEGRELAYVTDGQGVIIFHPDTFLIGEAIVDTVPVARALTGASGAVRVAGLGGHEVVAGYAPVPRTSWVLVTEDPWVMVTETTRPYVRSMIGLLVLGVLIPVGVVALGVRRITEPLAELTEAADRVASGEFEQAIEVRTGDELELLATQFNTMAAELRTSYATLEQRVADRTRELAILNALAAVVSRSLELEEVMSAALHHTSSALAMEAGGAFILECEGLVLVAHQGVSTDFAAAIALLPLSVSIAADALQAGVPVTREVEDYPEGSLKQLLADEGVITVVSVPLVARDRVLGVLNLISRRSRTLTDEERTLLAAIGQQAGVAAENARLYAEAERTAAAEERNRLARDLHDAVSQTLFSASLIADVVPKLWLRDREEAERQLVNLHRLTRGALAEMRTLLLELRPAALEAAELSALLGHLARAGAGRGELGLRLDLREVPDLSPDVKIALYRIAQEASNNVVRHANAHELSIRLDADDDCVRLEICDDGVGFEPCRAATGGLGTTTMHERAAAIGATLTIASRPGEGTCVRVLYRR